MKWRREASLLLVTAGFVLLPASGAAQEQPPRYFEEAPSRPHLELQWDALVRYDNVSHWQGYEPFSRGRFMVRPEVDFVITPALRLGVRGSFNYSTESEEYNAYWGYEDNFVYRGVYVDRYFLSWTPGAWTFQGGDFALPVVASPMLWDRYNIQTPGASASYLYRLGPTTSLTFTGAGIYSAQHGPDESILGVGQVVWKTGEESRFAVQASSSFWNMDMRNIDAQYFRQNRVTVVNGKLAYRSKFQLLDTLVRLQFPLGGTGLPVTVSLDFVHNFGIVGTGPNAYEAALTVGSVGTPKTWRGFFVYQYIGRDALVGAYNTDEWWWHTWATGYRFGVSYTVLPQVYLQAAFVFQRRLDQNYWLNRIMIDLAKMF